MPESWVQCVTRVYKQNRAKYGKGADGKYKYKFKNAMKDAKQVYKLGKTAKGKAGMSRKMNKRGRKTRRMRGGDETEEESGESMPEEKEIEEAEAEPTEGGRRRKR